MDPQWLGNGPSEKVASELRAVSQARDLRTRAIIAVHFDLWEAEMHSGVEQDAIEYWEGE